MVDSYILCGMVLLLAILNVVDRYRFARKESELLNRLMSRDFADYAFGMRVLEKKKEKTVNDLMKDGEKILPVD